MRLLGASSAPDPHFERVALQDIASKLPATTERITAEERHAALRRRHAAVLTRCRR